MHAAVGSVAALGPSAPAALVALHEFLGGGTVTQLSSVLGLSHSGTVRLVDRLAAEGLVERAGAEDGRAVSVVLTPTGRDTAAGVLAARQDTVANAMSALTPDDVDHLRAAAGHDADHADPGQGRRTCRRCERSWGALALSPVRPGRVRAQ